ncbi:DoxX family protein [Micromonospora sp. NBC_00330]|uniref:DoxX family protein n=1 Tax=Micromonospora sp. NBC_00330 TaxID=2903585 RepID=UPI002E2B29E2|nr:DoxX family protein [Micromonospora sp. NBC_00330]
MVMLHPYPVWFIVTHSPEEPFEMVQPWWPLALLAVIQLCDAVLCVKPVAFIRKCLIDVRFPERFWKFLPPLKAAAAAGLIVGIWVPPLAVLVSAALVCYFAVAVSAHVRASDFGRNLFLNATAMLVICSATLAFTVQSA